jgi:hypothetical protein
MLRRWAQHAPLQSRGHDKHAARIVQGIDGVLVDNDVMRLASVEAED